MPAEQIGGGRSEPGIATNETFYLKLIESLVETTLATLPNRERTVLFRGITVLLPEYWYNWPREGDDKDDRGRYSLQAMNDYRKKVEGIVEKSSLFLDRAAPIYDRLVLVSNEAAARTYGLRSPEEAVRQANLAILFPMVSPEKPYTEPLDAKFYRREVNSLGLADSLPPIEDSEKAFLILDKPLVNKLKWGFPEPGVDASIQYCNGTPYQIVNLLRYYVSKLHTSSDRARYKEMTWRDFLSYREINKEDFDLWLVGWQTNGAEKEWLAAISTTMKPGYGTMLLRVITDPVRAKKIGDFWDSMFLAGKRWWEEKTSS